MSTGGNLPADIISEILLRLPTKSLGRFKLVSKSWRALISDPKFTKTHLKFTLNNCSRRPRLLFSDYHQFFQVVDIDYDGEQPYLSLSKIEFKESHLWINIRGSCNGLVFVQTMINSQLFLLNPTTRECKKLPNLIDVNFNTIIYYGLGYDSTSDDYKVVIYDVGVVNIYSLRSDAWKMVQASPFGNNNVYIHDRPGISLNDSIHWICRCVSPSSVSIVAFDLAHENFKIVPHPRAFHPLAGYLMLYEVGGCLYLFKDHSQEIDIWIMKDYGVESSWTKFGRVTTGTVEGLYFYSIFYLSDKELVSMHKETREIKIVTCNVKEKTSRSVTLDGVGPPYYFASTFLDSLVSPQQFNRGTTTFLHVITSKDLRQ